MSVTFLFGSGADTCYKITLPSGAKFSEALLNSKYSEQCNSLYKDSGLLAEGGLKNYKLIYPTSKKVYIQTIVKHEKYVKDKDIFDNETDEIIEKCKEYQNRSSDKDKDFNNYTTDKCSGWYKILTEPDNNDVSKDKIREFFLENAVFHDTLDEKFNSLRELPLDSNGKRVVGAYTTIFFLMLYKLYEDSDKELKKQCTFEKLFDLLQAKTAPGNQNNYYEQLKKLTKDHSIVTTNYTDIIESVTEKEVTYLHGKMTWFEDLKNLTIYDCTNEKERMLALKHKQYLIPYILIPSGVKPLICKKQIEQFHSFIDKLDNSEELCVIGYAFNSEDNHVNSIIADWLRKDNKRLIYFNFVSDVKDIKNSKQKTKKEFNYFDQLSWCDEFKDQIMTIKEPDKIDFSKHKDKKILEVYIGSNNSIEIFEKYIKYLNGQKGE